HRPLRHAPGRSAEEGGFWAVVRHRDVREVFRRHDEFCSGQGFMLEDVPPEVNDLMSFIALDPPRHTVLRRLVNVAFTPRALARLEPKVADRATAVIDDLIAQGPGDFVEQVAKRLPLWAICEMLGVSPDQRADLAELMEDIIGRNDPSFALKYPDTDPRLFAVQGLHRLAEAGRALAADRRTHPRDDLMTALVQAEVDDEKLSDDDIGRFFNLLLSAGYDTTFNTMAIGLHGLWQHPDQWRKLANGLDEHLDGTIEEVIRWATVGINFRRTSTRAVSIAGQTIEPDEKVVLFLLSANRDESVFGEPWRFDITRAPNPHIAFGGGIHFCLGSALARMELKAMFRELFRRLPHLEIGAAEFAVDNHLNAMKRLEVAF
ncbi:MAG TPA: cytochrome P450, partial [Pseudonocardia sp.]|nr:cytochrome P450 [Pseudonocardia sp.]